MILPNDATIAVADGTRMRLFRNKGAEPHIRLVELPEPEIEIVNRGSGARHRSASANPDATRLAEDNFAASAAEYLNNQVLEGTIATLFVMADSRTLGEMRRQFHDTTAAKLVGELARNLVGHSVQAIADSLAQH